MVASTTDLWQLATGSELLQQTQPPSPQKGLFTLEKAVCLEKVTGKRHRTHYSALIRVRSFAVSCSRVLGARKIGF